MNTLHEALTVHDQIGGCRAHRPIHRLAWIVALVVAPAAVFAAETIPYTEDFSGGLPSANWDFNEGVQGRIEVLNGRLEMDDTVNGSSFSLNEGILHVNLAGKSGVVLTVDHTDLNDEEHALPAGSFTNSFNGDGIAVSDDGVNWYTVHTWSGSSVTTQAGMTVGLDEVVNANPGLDYTADFRIKFQQYDNYTKGTDGRGWDNITVQEVSPPTAASGLVAATGNGAIDLTWNDNSNDETGFKIERKPAAGAYEVIATTASNVTSFGDNGVAPSTQYTYRVVATNSGVDATPSNESTATSPAVISQQPNQAFIPLPPTGTNIGWNYAMGYVFTPQVDGQITQLGGFFNGTKTVKLWQGGTELASAQVTSAGDWAYTNITPVNVTAGTKYVVAAYMAGSGAAYRTGLSMPATLGNITIDGTTYVSTSSNPNAVPNDSVNTSVTNYGMADVTFSAGGGAGPANFVYGMWNWDSTILGDNQRIAELVQYCLDLGITDLGFAINWNEPFQEDPNNIPALEDMLTQFHDNGIKVEMLAGSANWIFHPDIGPLQGLPEGGAGYDFGVQLIERFIAYQNARYQSNPEQCFDGIRLDIEPHGLREQVTNSMFDGWPNPNPNDERVVPGGDPDAVAIAGFPDEPLLFIEWDPTFGNGVDLLTGSALPPGAFTETPVSERNEIMLRFWDALKRYKSQLQDDRGAGHITNDPVAVSQFLVMATDQVPWYWTIGVQDENGTQITPENHLMVDHDDNPGTPNIEVFKAALGVPDRVTLMGYRDQYEHVNNDPALGPLGLLWFRSVKQWDEGNNLDDPNIGGPRGALPYLDSIGMPTQAGLEFITQQQLGFNSWFVTFGEDHTDPANHPRDPYSQLKSTIEQIGSDMLTLYPNSLEGIRYHEYVQPIPGKSADAGELFPAFATWTNLEVFPSNLADWQTFHNVTNTTAVLPPLNNPPSVPNGDSLTLTITNLSPGPGLTGVLQARVNGLPGGTAANDFHVVAYVKVLGDTNYFQGGKGFPDTVSGLTPAQNGQLDASGNFTVRPIRIGDPTVAKVVWWLDLRDSNGHFVRRFTLDPIDHCFNDPNPANGCVPLSEIRTDRFYDPQDPLNIDVRGSIPVPIDLTFSNVQINGDIQKSAGADIGSISGTISGFPAGTSASDFHVRTWVEFTHEGHDPVANTDPNWDGAVNVWNLLSSDVEIDAAGNFTATNLRPINATGDSDAFGGTNGNYKLWISVHDGAFDADPSPDGVTRIGCPDGLNGIKPSAARFLDMDFSLVDTFDAGSGTAGIDVNSHLISVDHSSGIVAGNATGLDPTKTYYAYVWTEWYDIDQNIWQERAEPISSNTIEISKGGYFQVPITQLVPGTVSTTTSNPDRNIWVSIHDRPLDLNEFDIIDNWSCGGADPAITGQPLWLGRFFHMDSSFDYYEGYRPTPQTGSRNTSSPSAAPNGGAATALDAFTVKLDWNDASTNEVGFKIERRANGGSWSEVAKVAGKSGSGNAMSWTFAGLSPNTAYDFRIRAFNVSGAGADLNSGYSAIASATTPAEGPISIAGATWNAVGAAGWTRATLTNLPVGPTYRVHVWLEPNSGDPTQYHQGRAENVQNGVQFNTDDGPSANNGLWSNASVQQTMAITVHDASQDTIGSTSHPTVSNVAGLSSLPGVVEVFVGTEIHPNANNVD